MSSTSSFQFNVSLWIASQPHLFHIPALQYSTTNSSPRLQRHQHHMDPPFPMVNKFQSEESFNNESPQKTSIIASDVSVSPSAQMCCFQATTNSIAQVSPTPHAKTRNLLLPSFPVNENSLSAQIGQEGALLSSPSGDSGRSRTSIRESINHVETGHLLKPNGSTVITNAAIQPIQKSINRRSRMYGIKRGNDAFSWARKAPRNGYIQHPDAKWLMHPSFFNDGDHKLCQYGKRCMHERDCSELRVNMATLSYLRNRKYTSFRDMELIWGVSRPTIQRKARSVLETKQSDFKFILY